MKPLRVLQFMLLLMSLLKAIGLIAGTAVQASETNAAVYTQSNVKTGIAFLFATPPTKHKFPAELVGTWYTGALPLTDVYDTVTGAWRAQNGLGQTYSFRGDGHYTYAAFLRLQTGMCLTEVATYREGMAKVAGVTLTLTPEVAKTRTVIDCGSKSDTTTDDPRNVASMAFHVAEQPGGHVGLAMAADGVTISFNRHAEEAALARVGRLIP